MKSKIRVILTDDNGAGFMGIGLLRLLLGIKEHKSIQGAAGEMHLSYPKALAILNRLEEKLGREVVLRRRGGRDRGGAELTSFGEEFAGAYARLHRQVTSAAGREFRRFAARLDKARARRPGKGA